MVVMMSLSIFPLLACVNTFLKQKTLTIIIVSYRHKFVEEKGENC